MECLGHVYIYSCLVCLVALVGTRHGQCRWLSRSLGASNIMSTPSQLQNIGRSFSAFLLIHNGIAAVCKLPCSKPRCRIAFSQVYSTWHPVHPYLHVYAWKSVKPKAFQLKLPIHPCRPSQSSYPAGLHSSPSRVDVDACCRSVSYPAPLAAPT